MPDTLPAGALSTGVSVQLVYLARLREAFDRPCWHRTSHVCASVRVLFRS